MICGLQQDMGSVTKIWTRSNNNSQDMHVWLLNEALFTVSSIEGLIKKCILALCASQ